MMFHERLTQGLDIVRDEGPGFHCMSSNLSWPAEKIWSFEANRIATFLFNITVNVVFKKQRNNDDFFV